MNSTDTQLLGWSPELIELINSVYLSLIERGYHPPTVFNRMSDYLDQHENADLGDCIRYGLGKDSQNHDTE